MTITERHHRGDTVVSGNYYLESEETLNLFDRILIILAIIIILVIILKNNFFCNKISN